jgi:hypothetical protein
MAAGAWVFPIGIVAFVGFLASFLVGHPATPAAFLVVKPGDTVTYEETAFYGDGLVAWSTREDLLASGALRVGPYGVIPKTREFQTTLPANATNITDPLLEQLVGKRVNETFRTEPRDNYYGDWQQNGTVDRTIAELPTVVTLRTGQSLGGSVFNASAFAGAQSQRLGRPLQVGDDVPCDFGTCRIESFDASQVTYRQVVVDGARLPLGRFIFFPDQEPQPRTQFILSQRGDDRFAVEWDTVDGDAFILRNNFGNWPPGYYRFGPRTDGSVAVQYRADEAFTSDRNLVPAHLIGEPVWFELTVTQIE